MAIEKRFIHFKKFSDFNSKKLSANEANTQYTVGVSGAIQNGEPDILYQSYIWIKDTKQQWTHGQLYDGTNLNEAGFLAGEETSDQLDDVETHTYVKYVPQTLTDEQKAQTRINIGAVSEDNFKTINGESILGSGNITISGGSSSSGGNGAYSEVNHGTSDTTFTLTPNTFHVWDEVASLTLDFGSETSGVANEFLFQFTSGATATSLTLPDDIKWANELDIEPNMIYQVSILNGLASVLEFSNAPELIENKVTLSTSGTKYLVSLQYAAASDIIVKVRTPDGPISVNILSGETSKMASPVGPMVNSSAYIESIIPTDDNIYNYVW